MPPQTAFSLPAEQRGWLHAALLDDPRSDLDSVLSDIAGDRAQLWAAMQGDEVHALVVTRIVQYDRCSSFAIQLCGGHGALSWVGLIGELEHHARHLGCRFMELQGRAGWARLLPDYASRGIALAKEL